MLKDASLSLNFRPLQLVHFPLLLKWINTKHVSRWWRENREWSLDDVIQKYETYCEGYKVTGNSTKPIHAFIIEVHSQPIGFIQYYNANDFPRENGPLPQDLSENLAALDLFIGEPEFIGKGFGPLIIEAFLNDPVKLMFKACFVDPDCANKQAIRAYEKTGFQRISSVSNGKIMWMVKMLS